MNLIHNEYECNIMIVLKGGKEMGPSSSIQSFEEIRTKYGNEKLKKAFVKAVERNEKQSVQLLNHSSIEFATLYLLRDELSSRSLIRYLNERNKTALSIVNDILSERRTPEPETMYAICDEPQHLHSILSWMLLTGKNENLSMDYRLVIDRCASLLTTIYREQTILEDVVDLMFVRNKNNHSYHYLTWSLFEAREPSAMVYIAEYFRSADSEDVDFCTQLLRFIPEINEDNNSEANHTLFLRWYEANLPYLFYNGESLDTAKHPVPYEVALDAKYLGRPANLNTGGILGLLTDTEEQLLNAYYKISNKEQIMLSTYSFRLRKHDLTRWQQWIQTPFHEQLALAKEETHD
ncbi:hypothetical protein [Pseudalkalibacillus caeni]|uniref:Uncharacterized protein n=1 Tax=Exobacillus caeni TaxID=2574798 RepID=A0A5R9F573_9BACL|nr:hypothetical protein [Pseudalkalibacillus caeni]TLS38181.1 hypothetical protein FCL54_06485 [Pseudalkalibacillus caeni]